MNSGPPTPRGSSFEVISVAGLVTVQDGGRPGWMHEGVPPGGALVPSRLARANGAAGNTPGEAALEIVGSLSLRARGPLVVASDEGVAVALRAGDAWALATRGERVRYAAFRGGLDVPLVLGGRGTLLVASLGGHEGRALRGGDVLHIRPTASVAPASLVVRLDHEPRQAALDHEAPIRVVLGPDGDRFHALAAATLLGSTYHVSPRSDRTGVRLAGPALTRADDDTGASAPMVRGAIQVPASGEPIVLGPDHPTTGGYPVLATVVGDDVGALMARPVGALVRFALAGGAGTG